MKIKWHGDQFTRRLTQRLGRGLDAAGEHFVEQVTQVISTPGPPRSDPGNPPHIDTHQLIESFDHAVNHSTLVMAAGSDVPWSVYLETGTGRMAPRPYMVSTFIASANQLARLVLNTP